MSSTMKNPVSIEGADNDVERARDDNDPQAIFYLNPVPLVPTSQQDQHASKEDILITLYFWATKIEHTVQSQFGKGSDQERHSVQASWDRAAYRAKLLDYLAKTTPWLMVRDSSDAPSELKLTGDYHDDKLLYQKPTHEFLREQLPQIPVEKLRIIERYIAETMVLGQEKLTKVCRFALALPVLINTGSSSQSGLRVILFAFEPKPEGEDGKVDISRSMYEAGLNQKLFDQQNFDQGVLNAGKKTVSDATFDLLNGAEIAA